MARQELKDLTLNIYRSQGDALAGHRIIGQARRVGKPIVVPGTSTHRIQEIVMQVNALCVLDRPFRLRDGAKRLKLSTKAS